jgi:regulatory protein
MRSRAPSRAAKASACWWATRAAGRSIFPTAKEKLPELKARALRCLARREHSRAELARKLQRYAESQEILEGLLGELEGSKLLSNPRFAEMRVRVLSRKYGAAKIRHDLKARGVDAELAARATEGLDDLQRAREILARKYHGQATTREERARRARFLQSRGFSYETIRSAIAEVDAE